MGIKQRIYNDFFRPSKEKEYELILKVAQENGYEFHTVLSFEKVIRDGIKDYKRYIILRRDIDTADSKILQKMLELEKMYGARATYYFRWNTIDKELMKDIEESGGEASYHYEEIATYCYKKHIKTQEEMWRHIEDIRDLFIKQYNEFKHEIGLPCLTVASHGDFMNAKIGVPNKELIDGRVRSICGIVREAYDEEHISMLTSRVADQNEMENFTTKVLTEIEKGEPVLELLTHPRQWNSPVIVNLKEEINRIGKEIYWRLLI